MGTRGDGPSVVRDLLRVHEDTDPETGPTRKTNGRTQGGPVIPDRLYGDGPGSVYQSLPTQPVEWVSQWSTLGQREGFVDPVPGSLSTTGFDGPPRLETVRTLGVTTLRGTPRRPTGRTVHRTTSLVETPGLELRRTSLPSATNRIWSVSDLTP